MLFNILEGEILAKNDEEKRKEKKKKFSSVTDFSLKVTGILACIEV